MQLETRQFAGEVSAGVEGCISGLAARAGVESHPLCDPKINGGKPFRELIEPGAFVLADNVSLLLQHEKRELLCNTVSGCLQIDAKPDGLWFSAKLPDTQRCRDAFQLVSTRVLAEMSFGFFPIEEAFRDGIRRLRRIYVRELSIVELGQYPSTVAEARSLVNLPKVGSRAKLRLRFAK